MSLKFPATDLPALKDVGDSRSVRKSILDLLDKLNQLGLSIDNLSSSLLSKTYTSSVLQANAVSLTTSVVANITSLTVPAGKYDISAAIGLIPQAATSFTSILHSISLTSLAISPGGAGELQTNGEYRNRFPIVVPTIFSSSNAILGMFPTYRAIFSVQTTLYLTTDDTFTAGTCSGFGWLQLTQVTF